MDQFVFFYEIAHVSLPAPRHARTNRAAREVELKSCTSSRRLAERDVHAPCRLACRYPRMDASKRAERIIQKQEQRWLVCR